jgi:flagellar biosynthesis/type III secretory pathway chaperone
MQISPLPHTVSAASLPLEQLAKNPKLSESEKIAELSRQFEAVLLRQILGEAQKSVIRSHPRVSHERHLSGHDLDPTGGHHQQNRLVRPGQKSAGRTDPTIDQTEGRGGEVKDSPVSTLVSRLITLLRAELHEYGEMLAQLDQQQESVMARAADDVLRSVASINEQMAKIQSARQQREACQNETARFLNKPEDPLFQSVIPLLPEKFQVAVASLVRENNELLLRVQRRAQQNHLLLTRSLQMMQQVINSLVPASPPTIYNEDGVLRSADKPVQVLYEAVG